MPQPSFLYLAIKQDKEPLVEDTGKSNNIKLRSVISSIHTLSAMDMIRLLAKGVTDQEQLLNCARGKVIAKKDQLVKALDGTLQTYHHTQLQMLLQDYDHVQKQVD